MPKDGQHRLPQDLLPVGDTLRRPLRPRPERGRRADPLTPWRRAMLRRLVGWLAARFEAAARACDGEAAGRYLGYAGLLRRIDGDMALGDRPEALKGRRRGHLTVIGEE